MGDELFEGGANGDGFAAEGDGGSVGLVGFRFFQFGGDFGEACFEGEDSLFEVIDLGSVLFLKLALGLAGFGFGSFLFFGFAGGGGIFRGSGGGREDGSKGLGIGKLFPRGEGGAFGGSTRFIEVVLIVARIGGEVTGADMEDSGGHGPDKVDVVADEDEGALVLAKGGDEGVDGTDVQMGGGLVHEEEIGGIEQKFDQGEARLFSPA